MYIHTHSTHDTLVYPCAQTQEAADVLSPEVVVPGGQVAHEADASPAYFPGSHPTQLRGTTLPLVAVPAGQAAHASPA